MGYERRRDGQTGRREVARGSHSLQTHSLDKSDVRLSPTTMAAIEKEEEGGTRGRSPLVSMATPARWRGMPVRMRVVGLYCACAITPPKAAASSSSVLLLLQLFVSSPSYLQTLLASVYLSLSAGSSTGHRTIQHLEQYTSSQLI